MLDKVVATLFALMAAAFYAINMPFSKMLVSHILSTIMAEILYLGAGIGIMLAFLFNAKKIDKNDLLAKSDLPYTIGMIVLDILASISLLNDKFRFVELRINYKFKCPKAFVLDNNFVSLPIENKHYR